MRISDWSSDVCSSDLAKCFTMLVYLSTAPGSAQWGTDIYDAERHHAGRAPAGFDQGLIFVPASDTWHGFEPRRIDGVRRSIIVNYVVPEWRARPDLAVPEQPGLEIGRARG